MRVVDCCAECNASLIAENSCDNEVYEYAKIYVRKITKDHSEEDIQNILEVSQRDLMVARIAK